MRRDMDLVRSILMQAELADGPLDAGMIERGEHSEQELYYHIELMAEHGLVEASVQRAWNNEVIAAAVDALTWDGQDYLDAMRDDRLWAKSKRAIERSVGTTTFEVIKAVCVKAATDMAIAQLSA